ncbi:MAG: efflux RND transporter periplasmic adaptor subunit [Thermogemmatispora sp.]|uniref:efflux RND transporter periplasmic adaptor subunit n=2 Tax=Thermogemmatispora sp. TaxID=1968838 RepID=UPI001D71E3FF|nr:efflux RND transporter periplasmic adaptor subunit [Thermogemmatispora sp.]MBX5448829.1 efflux RND transporter periplasmic adaptor subunit [Thermogemmatispora sp.]
MSDVETNLQPLLEDEGSEIATEEAAHFETKLALPTRRRRRRGWVIATVVVVVLLLATGGVLAYLHMSAQQQPQYTLATVTTGNLSVTVSGTGPIQPRAQYNLNFPSSVGGQISEIDVQVGQHVTKGQVLAKVNSPSLQDAVTQAQQAVNNAQTAYNDAVNSGASQSQLDQLKGQLQSAQDQLAAAQHNLAQTVLTAPSDGTIVAINGTVGQTPGSTGSGSSSGSSGGSGNNAFMVLVDTSSLTIAAAVNEADIANVQVGQPASFTVAAYPNRTFHATVSSVDILGQNSSNVVSYTVDLTVDQNSLNGAHIYPGMTATVNITTQQRIGVLLVPNQALTFTNEAVQVGAISRQTLAQVYRNAGVSFGQGSNASGATGGAGQSSSGGTSSGSTRVVLTLRNGQLTPVVIQTGLTNGTYTEVTSGLQDGDQVVVSATGGVFSNLSTTSTGTGGGGLGGGNGFGGGGARFFGGGGGGR